MKQFYTVAGISLVVMACLFLSCKSASSIDSDEGFSSLFVNGSGQWEATGTAEWEWQKDELIGKSGVGYMVSREMYSDFILEVEFMPSEEINSGIFIRCPEGELSPRICYEINIWDDHDNQDFRTGSIVTYGKPLSHVNTVGKWNLYRIEAIDNHISVWLNDKKTAEITDDTAARGTIALQANGPGWIKFRNVRVKPL